MALLAWLPLAAGGACEGNSTPPEEPPDAARDGALDASNVNPSDAGSESSIAADATAPDGTLDANGINPSDTGSESSIAADATTEAGTVAYDCADAGQMSTSADLTFTISNSSLVQETPEVGFDGQNFLLAWFEGNPNDLGSSYASRVTPKGVALDNPPTQLVASGQVSSVAFNGTNYLVAWENTDTLGNRDRYVLASRITPQGTNLDPAGIAISSSSSSESNNGRVACGVGTCLVVWADVANKQVNAVRVDATAGTVLDASPILLASGGITLEPVGVDFDGADFFVVSSEFTGGQGAYPWVKISPAGAITSRGSSLALPASASGSGTAAAMAFGGSGHLFAWGTLMSYQPWNYYASRLNLDGGVLDPAGLLLTAQGATQSQSMEVDFDGCRYFSLWAAPASLGDGSTMGAVAGTVIEGIRISPDGSVEPSPLRIPSDAGSIESVQLGSSGRGQSLVASTQCDSQLANCLVHARVVTSD